MSSTPLISICIPAYKNINFLKRLLDSIAAQTFTDYEVIVTDDSPDYNVKQLLDEYNSIKNIHYYRNRPASGTPENWNEGIRRASGTWIKIMHDDDWFATPEALKLLYNSSQRYPRCSFFFSAFQNVMHETGHVQVVRCNRLDRAFLSLSPLHLFKRVYIGNPSCTFIKKDVGLFYDKDFKFVVDFEYYIRCIRKLKTSKYIDKVLLNIGFNNEQVTKYTFLVAEIQIPENLILLKKLGVNILRNPFVYDYYWRMFRNLNIRSVQTIKSYFHQPIHPLIIQIVSTQAEIPVRLLKIGALSKIIMTSTYILSLFKKVPDVNS
jgi:glycosyltransferase involved in cell wall biosynthesis